MDRQTTPLAANQRLAAKLRDLMARRATLAAELEDILREQGDLAFRCLRRRRIGDRPPR